MQSTSVAGSTIRKLSAKMQCGLVWEKNSRRTRNWWAYMAGCSVCRCCPLTRSLVYSISYILSFYIAYVYIAVCYYVIFTLYEKNIFFYNYNEQFLFHYCKLFCLILCILFAFCILILVIYRIRLEFGDCCSWKMCSTRWPKSHLPMLFCYNF